LRTQNLPVSFRHCCLLQDYNNPVYKPLSKLADFYPHCISCISQIGIALNLDHLRIRTSNLTGLAHIGLSEYGRTICLGEIFWIHHEYISKLGGIYTQVA